MLFRRQNSSSPAGHPSEDFLGNTVETRVAEQTSEGPSPIKTEASASFPNNLNRAHLQLACGIEGLRRETWEITVFPISAVGSYKRESSQGGIAEGMG